jgi:DNA-binding IclR family transcriptional regulator
MHDWSSEVLRALVGRPATVEEAARQLERPLDEVREELALLEEEGYVDLRKARGSGGESRYALTSAGHRALDPHG